MSWSTWVALFVACLLISVTPGAGAINTMTNAIAVGHRRAIWGILGQQAALLIQLVIVAAGLGVIIARSPTAFDVIRYTGAAYLVYLGIRQILRRVQPEGTVAEDAVESTAETPPNTASVWTSSSMFTRGLWVNLLNPKAIVFLLAFIPGFVRPGQGLLLQYLVIGVTIVAVDVAVMWLFFAVVGRGFARVSKSPRGARILNIVFGLLFICVGILLALV